MNKALEISAVISASAEAFGVSPLDITGPRRTGNIARARQASMAVSAWRGLGTLSTIAAAHGRDNHGTVIHACRAVEADAETTPSARARLMEISRLLERIDN